jgi:hypothetical protein
MAGRTTLPPPAFHNTPDFHMTRYSTRLCLLGTARLGNARLVLARCGKARPIHTAQHKATPRNTRAREGIDNGLILCRTECGYALWVWVREGGKV